MAALEPVVRRHRRARLLNALALAWGAIALFAVAALLAGRFAGWSSPATIPLLALAAGVAALIIWRRQPSREADFRCIAKQIEHEHPDLNSLLLAAMAQEPDPGTGRFNYLQQRVISEAIAHSLRSDWGRRADERLFFVECSHWAALIALAAALAALATLQPPSRSPLFTNASKSGGIEVTPGDTTLEKGGSLVVLAKFGANAPREATLVIKPSAGAGKRIPLVKNFEDPVFGGSLMEVNEDLSYQIEFPGGQTRAFTVKVFEYPRLERADATLTYPDYTQLPPKTIEDTRRVSAVEGAKLDYTFQLNKPVKSAKLIAKDKKVVELKPDAERPNVLSATFTLAQSQRYDLQLVDAEGRTNKVPAELFIDVLKNRPPELKFTAPKGDQRVSALEEIAYQAEAWDDFGLRAYGLAYTPAGGETKVLQLGTNAPANERRTFEHLLALESLNAEPDQLISYYVWAEDIGPDGRVRRTASDMYFAEVRPFEEIYREGQNNQSEQERQQQQSGNGQQAEKLAELQKQVITATWNIQRKETGPQPSANYKKDLPVVSEAQQQAREQLDALLEKLEDPRTKAFAETAAREMDRALKELEAAAKENSLKPLPPALSAEQSAYQALLKLAAREFEVTRQSRSGSERRGEQTGRRNQRQLDQLQLKQDANRYETQNQARPEQTPEQREQLQTLNRLKELARRQQDINERLKELQTALQEAKTEEEKEALQRQLKRLREEQREQLANMDELRQRMAQSSKPAEMSEAMQQLDQARAESQRAAEQLEKGQAQQALAAGTRAQEDLQKLRDDFRKKTSSQFTDEMRQMRQEARELAQRQEQIAEKMQSLADSKRKTLTDSGERKELAEQLARQTGALTNLLSDMKRVSEQSETVEPLLSRQLYDTLRRTDQERMEQMLNVSSELTRRGFLPQATNLEAQVRSNLTDLRRSVERAAESVLGDEAEALRLARRELDDLAEQARRELAQGDPGQAAQARQAQQRREGTPAGQEGGTNTLRNLARRGSDTNATQMASAAGGPPQREGGQPGEQASDKGRSRAPGDPKQRSEQPGQRAQAGQPGQQPGQQPDPQGNPPGQMAQAQQGRPGQQGQRGERGEQPGQQGQPGQQTGQQPGGGQRSEPSQQQADAAQRGQGQMQAGNDQPGARDASAQERGGERGERDLANNRATRGGAEGRGGLRELLNEGIREGGWQGGPIYGGEYTQFVDRLRDIEEMLDDPGLRAEVARVRERVQGMRAEFKRHSKEPQWDMVRLQVLNPLVEIRDRVSEELARKEATDPLAPVDRDPVPGQFSELVRRYYERLGDREPSRP
jgi:hypothetical protein